MKGMTGKGFVAASGIIGGLSLSSALRPAPLALFDGNSIDVLESNDGINATFERTKGQGGGG